MGTIDGFLLEIETYTKNANITKDIVLARLANDGVITEEQLNNYSENWQIVIVKKTWFKKWMDKFCKDESNLYIYKYVKFEE